VNDSPPALLELLSHIDDVLHKARANLHKAQE